MKKLPVEVEKLKQAIRDEVKLEVGRINDGKFFLRAAICKRLFHDFYACNGYFGLEDSAQDKMTTIISIANFAKFNDFTATISKLTKPRSLDKPELEKSLLLERFFFKKFRFIFGVDPLTLYREQLAAGKSACHQQFVFYQSFLNVAASVWLLHRLVHSFDETVIMSTSETGCSFQTRNMESVVSGIDDDDKENDVHNKVPGFQVSRSVIKCSVYVLDKEVDRSKQATTHKPSIDQSPVTMPISSDKSLIKLDPSFTKSSLGDNTTTKLEMPFTNYDETPIKLDPFLTKSSSSNKPSTELQPLLADKITIKPDPSTDKSPVKTPISSNMTPYRPAPSTDDDTGPSPRTLVTAVVWVKRAVTHFARVLDTDMKKYPKEMEKLKQAIRDEVRAEVERPNDWKFLVRAFLCQRLFHDFDAPNGWYGLEEYAQDKMTTINSFVDFVKFKDLSATISKLMTPPSPDKPDLEKSMFLDSFCFKKFKFIFNEDTLPLYRDELAAVQSGCHPNTPFYQSFLNLAVSVWLLHRLVQSFDEKVDILAYEPGCPFQRQNMESAVPGVIDDDEDEENDNDVNIKVIFTVVPGFQVGRSVIKCSVCIRDEKFDRSQLAATHRPSIDKTPIKLDPSTDKSPVKTPISSNMTPYRPAPSTDDDTGPSPRTLVTAVVWVKRAVTHFARVLDTDMKKYPKEMEKLKQAIRDEVRAEVERPNDWKFLVRAFLCQRLFHDFDAPNGWYGLEEYAQDKMTTINSFVDFVKFKDLSATISKLMTPPSPDKPDLEKSMFLDSFCFKKFKFIFNEDTLPLYRDELAAVQSGCHPNTPFYQSFLNLAVSVWLLHRLVQSFDEKVDILAYEPGCPFQRQNMESAVPGVIDDDEDEENDNDVNIKVIFTVVPGFQVGRSVIKCSVCIRDEKFDRSQLAATHRPSIDKTPIKLDPSTDKSPVKTPISSNMTPYRPAPSTNKSPAKSSFSNKPSTNLESLFGNDDGTHSSRSHPGSLQTVRAVTSFSNNDSQVLGRLIEFGGALLSARSSTMRPISSRKDAVIPYEGRHSQQPVKDHKKGRHGVPGSAPSGESISIPPPLYTPRHQWGREAPSASTQKESSYHNN